MRMWPELIQTDACHHLMRVTSPDRQHHHSTKAAVG